MENASVRSLGHDMLHISSRLRNHLELPTTGTESVHYLSRHFTHSHQQIVARLGFDTVKTNLWTVAPNAVGFVFLLCVTKSSDYFRERTYHICFALVVSLVGMIILAFIDVLHNKGVAYFACFLMASGSYIPSCLVHSWHNNNNMNENSRAATTGLLVGLGNLGGILSAATFRTNYAPRSVKRGRLRVLS